MLAVDLASLTCSTSVNIHWTALSSQCFHYQHDLTHTEPCQISRAALSLTTETCIQCKLNALSVFHVGLIFNSENLQR